MLILEVDEHQHRSYSQDCERTRMFNIAQSEGGMPVRFVRYNPDTFKGEAGEKQNPTKHARKVDLMACLKHVQATPPAPGVFCDAIYIYYDGYGSNGHWARTVPSIIHHI
jgi:hypothetical protein